MLIITVCGSDVIVQCDAIPKRPIALSTMVRSITEPSLVVHVLAMLESSELAKNYNYEVKVNTCASA